MRKISIIGMGYVGLPLAVAFQNYYKVIGFDSKISRIKELNKGIDINSQFNKNKLKKCTNLKFTKNLEDLDDTDFFIVTVPTPIYKNKDPNLSHLRDACKLIGKKLKKNNTIIFESTVYPGCTENFCAKILEKTSGKIFNKDFFLGYSPERINFGDAKHSLENIKKIVSGSNKKTLSIVSKIYSKIINAGVYECDNIITAEAAKAIENAQRDINIAFVNEISIIFQKLNIDTYEVLNAAKTKWNFLDFKPGLVGGHCIGVDPYYLTYIAKKVGVTTKVIGSGRKTNDEMSEFLSKIILKKTLNNFKKLKKIRILVLGLSFKENINDIRNSKSIDLCNQLSSSKCIVDAIDPLINEKIDFKKFSFNKLIYEKKKYHALVLAVPHTKIINSINSYKKLLYRNSIIFDIKNSLSNLKIKNIKIIKL